MSDTIFETQMTQKAQIFAKYYIFYYLRSLYHLRSISYRITFTAFPLSYKIMYIPRSGSFNSFCPIML